MATYFDFWNLNFYLVNINHFEHCLLKRRSYYDFFPFFHIQLLEAETVHYIFNENLALCNEVTERVIQQIIHSIEQHGRNVQYLRLLQTLLKAEGQLIRKTQDSIMSEVYKKIKIFTKSCCLTMNSKPKTTSIAILYIKTQERKNFVFVRKE